MVGFKSGDVSRAAFNAKVKALSDRLGPITKNERQPPKPRQRVERMPPASEEPADEPDASDPEADGAEAS